MEVQPGNALVEGDSVCDMAAFNSQMCWQKEEEKEQGKLLNFKEQFRIYQV